MTTTRLVPTDDVLPFLAAALDEQAMRRVFGENLKARCGADVEVTACGIERVKYRPRRNCIIGYRLKVRDTEGEHEQRLCAGTYTTAEAHTRYDKAVRATSTTTPYFAPVTLIAALDMVVWAFPNERKLMALPLLIEAAQLRETLLPEVVRDRWGDGWEIVDLSHTVSNYFPEHTCCVSVTLALSHMESGTRRSWEILGKTRYDDAGAETHRYMAALWRAAVPGVSYARPLAYQSEHRLLWQERVAGVTLHSLFVSGAADKALLIRVARAVAALHGTRVTSPRRVMLNNLIDHLKAAREVVATARPGCVVSLRQTVDTLVDRSVFLDQHHDGTWHGDLHSNNILVSPSQIYLVDMDRVSIGPPLADLGSFLAELIYRGCLNGEPLEAVLPVLAAVVSAYRQNVAWPAPEEDLAWFTANALIHERALRCVTSLKARRMETIDSLVAVALRIAQDGLFDRSAAPIVSAMACSEQAV